MGLYPIPCRACKKTFMWFSGDLSQVCAECRENAVTVTDKKRETSSFSTCPDCEKPVFAGTPCCDAMVRRLGERAPACHPDECTNPEHGSLGACPDRSS